MADSSAATATTLRRHNSIATSVVVPNKLSIPATPPHRTNSLELVSLKVNSQSPLSSYTSLRDVLPATTAAINSPNAASSAAVINSRYEISIRNRLVKQAAWAYLQPMSASPTTSSAPHFLRRLCHRFTTFLTFINHHLLPSFSRIFNRILHAFSGQVCS